MPQDAINTFLYDTLIPSILLGKERNAVNVEKAFRNFLKEKGMESGNEEEFAEKNLPNIQHKINQKLDELYALGIPPFFGKYDYDSDVYLTWAHPNFSDETGLSGLPAHFGKTLEWIDNLSTREFLVVCVLCLNLLGATEIYITDAPGDEGIDCIGAVDIGPFKSCVFYVQAKTLEKGSISKETIYAEYGKYAALPYSQKYNEYRKAVGADKYKDGLSSIYIFAANTEFKPPARDAARKLGVLLRSRIQLAMWLSSTWTMDEILNKYNTLKANGLKADLTANLANQL